MLLSTGVAVLTLVAAVGVAVGSLLFFGSKPEAGSYVSREPAPLVIPPPPSPLIVPRLAPLTAQPLPEAVAMVVPDVTITFYSCDGDGFCGDMYNGEPVYEGAAACSPDLPIGTEFVIAGDPTGRVYRCDDRGLLEPTWVDIFWQHEDDGWFWQGVVGQESSIDIVYVPASWPSRAPPFP